MFRKSIVALALALALGLVPGTALATNGYFVQAYGTHYAGMAGAGSALSLNSVGAASNPASMVFLGKRFDLGLAIFNPNRQYSVTGTPSGFPGTFGLAPGTVESGSKVFPIPSLGANWMLNESTSFGVALYGHGGMNTDYGDPTFGFVPTGVDLSQAFVAPTFAVKLGANHAIGISGILGYQRFRAQGVAAFAPFSSNPSALSDNGHSNSFGFGARFGYLGNLHPAFSIAASYQTKVKMGEFSDYAGLFAEQGGFDVPSNFVVGIAIKPNEDLAFVFDVQRVNYSEVNSVANPFLPNLAQSLLGADDGAGFGWEDMTIFKGGVQWRSSADLTWRAGYSYGEQPIRSSEVLFNILAPGVIEQHASFGLSKGLGEGKEINFAVTRAFSKDVTGPNPLEVPGLQEIELKMDQWIIDVSFSFGF
jgi:long-chain fatty acid transport protein